MRASCAEGSSQARVYQVKFLSPCYLPARCYKLFRCGFFLSPFCLLQQEATKAHILIPQFLFH